MQAYVEQEPYDPVTLLLVRRPGAEEQDQGCHRLRSNTVNRDTTTTGGGDLWFDTHRLGILTTTTWVVVVATPLLLASPVLESLRSVAAIRSDTACSCCCCR